MKIVEIMSQSALFLGLQEEHFKLDIATPEEETTLLENKQIRSLFNLTRYAFQELCTNYIPVVEKISVKTNDKKIEVKDLLATVSVGSVTHPMQEDHYIKWIIVETNLGYQVKYLQPDTKPYAEFVLSDNENVTGVYEFCNKHSVWKA
jgi:superoxide reductase